MFVLTFCFLCVFCPLLQMSCREILALPWRTLQRTGISASGSFSNCNLPRGESMPRLCRHWHFNIHQQEVHKNQKGRGFGVSLNPVFHFFCIAHPCRAQGVGCCFKSLCVRLLIFLRRRHTHAPYAFENTLRENPVFENDDGVLTHVSTLPCPSSSASSQSQQSEQEHFASVENIRLSIEVQ